MRISPDSDALKRFRVADLTQYLAFYGWSHESSDKWQVFRKYTDNTSDSTYKIMLPVDTSVPDLNVYLSNAINLLGTLSDIKPEEMLRQICLFNRDVLKIRNQETGEYNSITLKLAANQVFQFKQLIAFSACSERDPRTHFTTKLGIARPVLDHYRFGHTFRGSFGFTIESHIMRSSMSYQTSFPGFEDMEQVTPIERRVMERIIRGLLITQRATDEQDIQPLIESYPEGFNANMCDAIVGIVSDSKARMEYSVQWSPKLEPSPDVKDPGKIEIREDSYVILRNASSQLRALQPEHVTLRGHVIGLLSWDVPTGIRARDRSVTIYGFNPATQRQGRTIVILEREQYMEAGKAHLAGNLIEIGGVLQRVGLTWKLAEPHDFKILG